MLARQPVGFMTCRRGVLNVDVDRAVGIRHKAGAITYTVSVDPTRPVPMGSPVENATTGKLLRVLAVNAAG